MRTWRVGTISMGASLLFLGIFLLLSQFFNLDLIDIMMSWWPIILIVLGLEILVYLFMSRQEKPLLKYDFLSIFFVGIIGTVGIGLTILSSTGLLDFLDDALQREERTNDLPVLSQELDESITRVVLNTEHYPITVESSPEKALSMFGTYSATASKDDKLVSAVEDYLSIHQKGDTLFVSLKKLPDAVSGPFHSYTSMEATVLVPSHVKLEVNGKDNQMAVKPRNVLNDWKIDNGSEITLHLEKESDVKVSAVGVQELISQSGKWEVSEVGGLKSEEHQEASELQTVKTGSYKNGNGTHSISINDAYQVSLSTED